MPMVDIDLDSVQERKQLPANEPFTFTVQKAELKETKAGDSHVVYVELVPDESPADRVFHRWSLKQGAVAASSPAISIKKFFESVGYEWTKGGFPTEDLVGIRFVGTLMHEPYNGQVQVRLASVLGAA